MEERVAYSLRKASGAIIATSVTNFVAFLGTCFSVFMPISAFGIFAVIVVSIDYILIILILPMYYVLYEKHIQPLFSWKSLFSKVIRCLCCRCGSAKKKAALPPPAI